MQGINHIFPARDSVQLFTKNSIMTNPAGTMTASHGGSLDLEEADDLEINNNSTQPDSTRSEKTEAWWSVGEYLEGRGLTHQSAKYTLTGNRVFGSQQNPDEVWDLTDSIIELYEKSQKADSVKPTADNSGDIPLDIDVSVDDWLEDDRSHGFIRVYPAALGTIHIGRSQLVPCALSTSAHRICLMLGISINALHVQLHGDVIRRMDPYEHPLAIQNELLANLGFTDLSRIQQEGATNDLSCLVKFYAGKPLYDSTFSRNQLQACLEVKKGGVLQNWARKMCVLSGTRLLIYKDKFKRSQPSSIQLAKGSVEEADVKGHKFCLKLTISVGGEKVIWLSFAEQGDYNKWFRRCKKVGYGRENIFINEQLAMLNLRHNVLRERPLDEDTYAIGWLDDLQRFRCLRSLNLADNNLVQFPSSLCSIPTLVELNIASNRLEELPPDIAQLSNLQALHIHNNQLSSLPSELLQLRKLFILVLAFNRFTVLPPVVAQMTNVRTSEVENIIMAGNDIKHIPSETLMEMKYVKKVDLRMNQLTLNTSETMKLTVLEHLTHLDIRDNQITDLDIRSLRTLEYLNVERNDMVSLQANGMAMKTLFMGHNCIERLIINPKPEWLLQIDVSYNCLMHLPDWLSDCFFLQKLWASSNLLSQLPPRLFNEARKLKSVRADHNRLTTLPPIDLEGTLSLEELLLHHNQLTALPPSLLAKANKLRILNLSKNRLSTLPPLNPNQDLNRVQELYVSANCLGDSAMAVISEYSRLKILHISHNEIYSMDDADISKLELLQELNISGNQLRQMPAAIGHLPRLVVLRAHSNILHSLPDFKNASALRILDVGHNQLLNVSVTHLMASQLNLLDMSLNAQLKVDPKEFKSVKHRKKVCLVDLTGQNRLLPGLKSRRKPLQESLPSPSEPDVQTLSKATDIDMDPDIPWKVGFSETAGMRNKLCIATLKLLRFRSENECVFGMFDGGHNNEVPSLLLECMEDILNAEKEDERTSHSYMKYAMLSAHAHLKASGQRLGASALLCHLHRVESADTIKHYTLSIANVGDVEAVLCRHGDALLLTRKFVTDEDRDECQRVFKSGGIVTEDNKVNGTTKNTRQLGCGFLYPHVIPDPYTNTIALRNDDEFIIIANRGLWHYVSYTEAVEQIYETGNPVVAAKQLQDLVQAYGCKENISILVIRLNTDKGPSLARLRQNRSMSIDDMEAAAKHEAKLQKHWQKRDAKRRMKKEVLIEEKPPSPPPKDYSVEHVSNGISRARSPTPPPAEPPLPPPPENTDAVDSVDETLPPPPQELLTPEPKDLDKLRPLPNQRYLKKTAASEWEGILQSRLSQEVKDLEMKQLSNTVLENVGFSVAPPIKEEPVPVKDVSPSPVVPTLKRAVTTPWGTTEEHLRGSNSPLLRDHRRAKQRGSIANTIALFENMTPDPRNKGRSVSVPRERVSSPLLRDRSPAPPAHKRPRSPPPSLTPRSSLSTFHKEAPAATSPKSPSSPVTPIIKSPSASNGLDSAEKPNVSRLVKMFATPSPGKLNERVEVQHVDDTGSVHVYEVAKL